MILLLTLLVNGPAVDCEFHPGPDVTTCVDPYWPKECHPDQWTDYCLEQWELNKYGSVCLTQTCIDERN